MRIHLRVWSAFPEEKELLCVYPLERDGRRWVYATGDMRPGQILQGHHRAEAGVGLGRRSSETVYVIPARVVVQVTRTQISGLRSGVIEDWWPGPPPS